MRRRSATSGARNSVGGRICSSSSRAAGSRRRARTVATGAESPARGGQRDRSRRQRFVEHRARANFVPVVIFGVDPEHGDGRHVVFALDLLGQLERRQGLEQREERSAKQPRLLAGDDGDRARVGEQPRPLRPRGRRVPPACWAAMTRRSPAAGGCAPACARSRRPTPRDRRDRRQKTVRRLESRTRSRRRAGGSTGSGAGRPESGRRTRMQRRVWLIG